MKKFARTLVALLLVMAMGTVAALAAVSPTADVGIADEAAAKDEKGQAVEITAAALTQAQEAAFRDANVKELMGSAAAAEEEYAVLPLGNMESDKDVKKLEFTVTGVTKDSKGGVLEMKADGTTRFIPAEFKDGKVIIEADLAASESVSYALVLNEDSARAVAASNFASAGSYISSPRTMDDSFAMIAVLAAVVCTFGAAAAYRKSRANG